LVVDPADPSLFLQGQKNPVWFKNSSMPKNQILQYNFGKNHEKFHLNLEKQSMHLSFLVNNKD
jgi:hypothetical protein